MRWWRLSAQLVAIWIDEESGRYDERIERILTRQLIIYRAVDERRAVIGRRWRIAFRLPRACLGAGFAILFSDIVGRDNIEFKLPVCRHACLSHLDFKPNEAQMPLIALFSCTGCPFQTSGKRRHFSCQKRLIKG